MTHTSPTTARQTMPSSTHPPRAPPSFPIHLPCPIHHSYYIYPTHTSLSGLLISVLYPECGFSRHIRAPWQWCVHYSVLPQGQQRVPPTIHAAFTRRPILRAGNECCCVMIQEWSIIYCGWFSFWCWCAFVVSLLALLCYCREGSLLWRWPVMSIILNPSIQFASFLLFFFLRIFFSLYLFMYLSVPVFNPFFFLVCFLFLC